MSERILAETQTWSDLALETEFGESAAGQPAVLDLLPKSPERAAAPISVQRSVDKLQKISSPHSRQKLFSAMGKKYSNNYLARVVAGYNNATGPNPAALDSEAEAELETPEAAPAPVVHSSAPLEIEAAKPDPTPDTTPTTAIRAQSHDNSASDSNTETTTSQAKQPAGEIGAETENILDPGGDGEGDPEDDEQRKKSRPVVQRTKATDQTAASRRLRRKLEPLAISEAAPASPANSTGPTVIQRTPAPVPEAPVLTPTPTADQDANVAAFKQNVETVKETQKIHEDTDTKVSNAQNAAIPPSDEASSHAEANKVGTMDGAQANAFDKTGFTGVVDSSIDGVTINHENDGDAIIRGLNDSLQPTISTLETEVETAQTNAKTEIQTETDAPLDLTTNVPLPASGVPSPEQQVATLEYEEAGEQPVLSTETIVPTPLEDVTTTIEYGTDYIDEQMGSTEVFTADEFEQLLDDSASGTVDFPEASEAKTAKEELETDVTETPTRVEQERTNIFGTYEDTLASGVTDKVTQAHSTRTTQFDSVATSQDQTKAVSETTRQNIATALNNIYTNTENSVRPILDGLRDKAINRFNELEQTARQTFVDGYLAKVLANRSRPEFDEGMERADYGVLSIFGGVFNRRNELIALNETALGEEREIYKTSLRTAADDVAALVDADLAEAKRLIADGKRQVDEYIAGLSDAGLQQVARDAAADLTPRFEALEQEVDQKYDEISTLLDDEFNRVAAEFDAYAQSILDANKSLLDRAADAINGVLTTINEMKDLLMRIIQKGVDVIGKILANPGQFLTNLTQVARAGVDQFISNIGTHLENSFKEWLFGNLADAGIELPAEFNLEGAINLALQILGIDYTFLRGKAVVVLDTFTGGQGDAFITKLEQAVRSGQEFLDNPVVQEVLSLFNALRTGGLEGLIEQLTQDISDFVTEFSQKVIDWLVTKLPEAAIEIASWFVPGAGFIQACQAICDTISQIMERATEAMNFVSSILDTIDAIAEGQTPESLVGLIESKLAEGLSFVISFLADLALERLGIGDLPEAIIGVVEDLRKTVEDAVDAALARILAPFQNEETREALNDASLGAVDLEAAIAAVPEFQTAELITTYKETEYLTRAAAQTVVDNAMADTRCSTAFTTLQVADSETHWNYSYSSDGQSGSIDGLARAETIFTEFDELSQAANNAIVAAKQAIENAQNISGAELADFRGTLEEYMQQLDGTGARDGDIKQQLDEYDALLASERELTVLTSTNLTELETGYKAIKDAADRLAEESVPVDDELAALFGPGDEGRALARQALRLFNNERDKLVEIMGWFDNAYEAQIAPRMGLVNNNIELFYGIFKTSFGGGADCAERAMALEAALGADFGQLSAALQQSELYYNAPNVTEFETFALDEALNVASAEETQYPNPALQAYHRWKFYKICSTLMPRFGLDATNASQRVRFKAIYDAYNLHAGGTGLPQLQTAYANFTNQFNTLETAFLNFKGTDAGNLGVQKLENALDKSTRSGRTVDALLEAWARDGVKTHAIFTPFSSANAGTVVLDILNRLGGNVGSLVGMGAALDRIVTFVGASSDVESELNSLMPTKLANDYQGLDRLLEPSNNIFASFGVTYATYKTWIMTTSNTVTLSGGVWGHSDNTPARDALYAREHYYLAFNAAGAVGVLGNYGAPGTEGASTSRFMPHTQVNTVGGTGLDVPIVLLNVKPTTCWSLNVNYSWLQGVIDRRGDFYIIADTSLAKNQLVSTLDGFTPGASVTANELTYLGSKGYHGATTRSGTVLMLSNNPEFYYKIRYTMLHKRNADDPAERPTPTWRIDDTYTFSPLPPNITLPTPLGRKVFSITQDRGATFTDHAELADISAKVGITPQAAFTEQLGVDNTTDRSLVRRLTGMEVEVEYWGNNAVTFLKYNL